MLDTLMRPLINRPLGVAGRYLADRGASADVVTGLGVMIGLGAAVAIALGHYSTGFLLIILNRIFDGLDGAVASASAPTDRGGYLDIVGDYVFYASVPLAFAAVNPADNALPAAALLASFCLTAASFLTFAIIAAKRGLDTTSHGQKSFFYSTGLIEGTETIVFFLIATLLPDHFPLLAWGFAALCVVTTARRSALAIKLFR